MALLDFQNVTGMNGSNSDNKTSHFVGAAQKKWSTVLSCNYTMSKELHSKRRYGN